jgi:hypothetical protein
MFAFFSIGAQELLVLAVLGLGLATAVGVVIALAISIGKKPHHDD